MPCAFNSHILINTCTKSHEFALKKTVFYKCYSPEAALGVSVCVYPPL